MKNSYGHNLLGLTILFDYDTILVQAEEPQKEKERMNFIKAYDGHMIDDYGSVNSADMKLFAKRFKAYIKQEICSENIELVNYYLNHYDVGGFIKKNNHFVYFSYDIPRDERIDVEKSGSYYGVLYRTTKDEHDYHGEGNNFVSLKDFAVRVKEFM